MTSSKGKGCSRRAFLKTAGTVGVSALASQPLFQQNAVAESSQNIIVPTRMFGKTGKEVSILSLGGMFDIPSNQIVLNLAMKFGVTYWDTANSYGNGASEDGIGKYFQSKPQDRSKIFLVSKAYTMDTEEMTTMLDTSLKRMNTDYIDLYFMHGISSTDPLTDKVRKWAENAKKQGKIRLFGFSTHQNMQSCLMSGSKLGWIDGIMTTYNFRLMHQNDMKEALQACIEAGIGITAMKTQGGGSVKTSSDTEIQLAGRFIQKGFTDKQAKLKAVWENPDIASICSQMPNSTILMSNISAALNKTSLAAKDMELMHQYALDTCSGYCAGCAHICEAEIQGKVPISDIMRYLMYQETYGEKEFSESIVSQMPKDIQQRIAAVDFSSAERQCPQKIEIGKLMRKASDMLA
ncbi:MAG: aldo/keto reductase [Desulfobacterium sp.]|nr:aldo/keto reductase [Desulfobacterium sp.]